MVMIVTMKRGARMHCTATSQRVQFRDADADAPADGGRESGLAVASDIMDGAPLRAVEVVMKEAGDSGSSIPLEPPLVSSPDGELVTLVESSATGSVMVRRNTDGTDAMPSTFSMIVLSEKLQRVGKRTANSSCGAGKMLYGQYRNFFHGSAELELGIVMEESMEARGSRIEGGGEMALPAGIERGDSIREGETETTALSSTGWVSLSLRRRRGTFWDCGETGDGDPRKPREGPK